MDEDFDACYAAVQSRDERFDGWFVTAVTSTGIYCRPSCPARTPGPTRVRFFPTAAAAQVAGFRACKRCRPDAAPSSPAWNLRADTVARAMRLIADGVVDRDGVGRTAGYIAMRALGDLDVFLATDLGVRHALEALGESSSPRAIENLSRRWRPWRSYAMQHLWASLSTTPGPPRR